MAGRIVRSNDEVEFLTNEHNLEEAEENESSLT